MDDTEPPQSFERLPDLVVEADGDAAVRCLEALREASPEDRKDALRELRSVAGDRPAAFEPLLPALTPFLDDDERPVRLTAVKLFVDVAAAEPATVAPTAPSLADRLADEDGFYYVRARAAEALGYVALEEPDAVTSPAVVADLRIGLEFDEPEVKEKLAKALELVAVGDPQRLRHRASRLADRLDDGAVLVRYHLTTALVAVGCDSPDALADVADAVRARLDDDEPFVRGRAAEALGLLARVDPGDDRLPTTELRALTDADEPFVAERARFAVAADEGGDEPVDPAEEVGTLASVRGTTDEAVEAITSPDDECPHCGLALPEGGPPLCPRCGTPR